MSIMHRASVALLSTIFVLSACDNDSSSPGGTTNRVTIKDANPPVITLIGSATMIVEGGSTFTDPGSTVTDTVDSSLIATVTGTVNTSAVGTYFLFYNVTDTSGNAATTVTRTVIVEDTIAPVITLVGADPLALEGGSIFLDPGSTVTDNIDIGLTATVTGTVDMSTVGSYVLTYNVTDSSGNSATPVTRTVNVGDTTAPVISLIGENPITILKGSTFTDPGSTVADNIDTGLTATVTGTVDANTVGSYILTYNATDSAGNVAVTVTRTVDVILLGSPTPSITIGMKRLQFFWPSVAGADHYRILVNPDGISGFTIEPTASNITTTSHTLEIPVHLIDWLSAQYIVEACNATETICSGSTNQNLALIDSIAATGYFKASNTDSFEFFGLSVALSADGNTLAVGSLGDSAATGVNNTSPGQLDNSAADSGAVYVFVRSGLTWAQQAYIKASNTDAGDSFGFAVSLSSDGNTMAVGATQEDSNASGIGGNEADDSVLDSGAVYVFVRSGSTWTQEAYIKASNTGGGDHFGHSVALSDDSNTLAVGAVDEASAATGVNNTVPGQGDNTMSASGAVYVFVRAGGIWAQEAYVKSSNTDSGDLFGHSVNLSVDGNTLAVGAVHEASATTGVNNTVPGQGDNTMSDSGAVYVFERSGATWTQHSYIKASNTGGLDNFGHSIALSSDSSTLAVGAIGEGSASTGINSTTPGQSDDSVFASGAVYVFVFSASTWTQQAYIKASNTEMDDTFGYALDLSADGNILAAGARVEDSAATGVGGDELDNTAIDSGAVYVYTRSGGTWIQKNYVKATNTEADDYFGTSVSLHGDGSTLAVGALVEDSAATGINGNELDNTATWSGAVYLY